MDKDSMIERTDTWVGCRCCECQGIKCSVAVKHEGHSCGGSKNVVWNGRGETRVVDPATGAEKGQKVERFDLIPNEFEVALATHYGVGARKYADRNWERGYKWSLSIGALRRHLAAWLAGEDNDPETGSNHLIAVAWHAIALFVFQLRRLGTDDVRSKR